MRLPEYRLIMNSITATPLIIGRFGRTFGVSGWIKIISFTTSKENILDFKPWLIKKQDSWEEFNYSESKIHAGSIVIKLPNCSSPEAASRFTNIEIAVWHDQLPKLKNDEYYCVDLIGLEVVNKEGVNFGVVQDIMPTGSNDVLVVVGERRRLIPYLSHVILKVDLTSKIITVDWEEDF